MYVRKAESTRGPVFVVMLVHMIIRRLRKAWEGFDLTVEGAARTIGNRAALNQRH